MGFANSRYAILGEFRMDLKILAAAAACAVFATASNASLVAYGSRAAFDAAYQNRTTFDWGVFGPAGTIISTPDERMSNGVLIRVGSSEGVLARHDEGTGFSSDFLPGEHLLTDAGSQSDTFIVRFGNPIAGFGVQIEPDALSGPWTGSIDLFDSSDVNIGHIVIGGTRGTAEDGSAPFYGLVLDTGNLSYAMFWVDNPEIFPGKSGSLALGRMEIVAGVPEAPALLLAGGGLLLLGVGSRRRQGLVK
jgi:hypothetical protein